MFRSRGRGALRHTWTFWRRSIQARVVVATVLLSILAVGAVGWFLSQQVRSGLLEHRVSLVTAEAANEVRDARSRLSATPGIDVDASGERRDLVGPIIQRGLTRGFDVVLAGPIEPSSDGRIVDGGAEFTPSLDISSIPLSLERHFADPGAATAWTYAQIRSESFGQITSAVPGIAVGSQVVLPADGHTYTLYFLFPLQNEQDTLQLVLRAMAFAAVLLVLLVAGVAWLVARQVVTPIRLARQVAERLAAGQLTERLRVTGEDDLARLAVSFNQMATSLQTQIRQLEELSGVQRRFTSDVSHELRTPLTTVRMASEVLYDARDTFDPATARAAELLQSELDRFERLLVDLLEISRFDAGAARLETDSVDLVTVVRRVIEDSVRLAEQRQVALRIHEPGHPCLAEADVRRVERIVRNLVGNAIDHAGTSDHIDIYVDGDEHSAAVAVRDHGVGLAPGESAMVFNRFWRADPARARTTGGTGLGLSISLEDSQLHGGWLQAWGKPGEGAQFRLTLPRRTGAPLRRSPIPLVPRDAGPDARREAATGASEGER
ncbi:MtrAB system histidine kinase MtrB [Nocardioides nematodiphilus]|uniref:MtrAB system histidine kinase MtrB n=1 Tax=Nocardioides nematodiphilus TaxID=2849669 RepID=UPI001CDA119A|nr:MtrAB system histidine kinase MtrB [Nocardioides nematodiphilus]MCA1984530.1 HAMP domain-containing histidine kinase [Nocardioides nematodiphilus]